MLNKHKICIDARMYNHSGIGKYLHMLLPYICNAYEVMLLGDKETLESLSSVAQIVPFHSPIYSISEQRKYTKVITKADLFWSPHYNVPLAGVRCKKRVATIHDVYHLAFYKELSRKQKIYAKLVINAAIKLSDELITVSAFSKNEIIKYTGCKTGKIQVVHNGVNQFITDTVNKNINPTYNLPVNYILFVGNVKPHNKLKNIVKSIPIAE